MAQHTGIFIFLAPFLGLLLVPLAGLWKKETARWIAATACAVSGYFSLVALRLTAKGEVFSYRFGGWAPPYGIEWRLDSLSSILCFLVSIIALTVILSTRQSVTEDLPGARLPFYMTSLLHLAGLFGILLTHDLFNLFVFLEVASLSGYALIASGDRLRGHVVSFRYLIIGSVGASFYLLGVGYLYAATGSLNMSDVALRLVPILHSRTVALALFFIVTGLAMKMALFPFHAWLPDAYAFASNTATALIAPLMTKVAIYALLRILFWVFPLQLLHQYELFTVFKVLGGIAILYSSLMALVQQDFKRLLAYSSLAHIGLIMLAVGIGTRFALTAAVLHILFHAVMKAGLFLSATSFADTHGVWSVDDLTKLRGRMPWSLRAMLLFSLSMIGLPPFCGFFSKWYIFLSAFRTGEIFWACAIVISGLLSALYFFRVIEKAFFEKPGSRGSEIEAPRPLLAATSLLAIAMIVLGITAPALFRWGLGVFFPEVVL